MAWVAVDKDSTEYIYEDKPSRTSAGCWYSAFGLVRVPIVVSRSLLEENLLGKMSQQNLNKIKQNNYGHSFIQCNDFDSSYLCSSCCSKYLFCSYVFHK